MRGLVSDLECKGDIFILRFIFIYLFGCVSLGCSMWDLVPWPGIKPGPPALEAWTLGFWTTREVPKGRILNWGVLVLSDQSSQFAQDQGVSWDVGPISANMEMFVCLEQIGMLSHSPEAMNASLPQKLSYSGLARSDWDQCQLISQPTTVSENCLCIQSWTKRSEDEEFSDMLSDLKSFVTQLRSTCQHRKQRVIWRKVSVDTQLGFMCGWWPSRAGCWRKESKGRGCCVEEERGQEGGEGRVVCVQDIDFD